MDVSADESGTEISEATIIIASSCSHFALHSERFVGAGAPMSLLFISLIYINF